MRQLTASQLLQIWEDNLNQPLYYKSVMLLTATYPIAAWETVIQWPIGKRDGLLLQLRQNIFGTHLPLIAVCPNCSEQVEWEMKTSELLLQTPPETGEIPIFTLESIPFKLRFRLPNTQDFLDETVLLEPLQLVRNCILEAEKSGVPFPVTDLPNDVFQLVENNMATEDPQANLTFLLNCPGCKHQWENIFDIMTYLWIEIDNWAKHLLQEVFILARGLGWSEHEIINMNAKRRQFYLEMLRS